MKKRTLLIILVILFVIGSFCAYAKDYDVTSAAEYNNTNVFPINYNKAGGICGSQLFAVNNYSFLGVLVVALPFDDTPEELTTNALKNMQSLINDSFAQYIDYISFGKISVNCVIPQIDKNGNINVVSSGHNRSYYEPYQTVFNPDGYPFSEDGQDFSSDEGLKRYRSLLLNGLDSIDKTVITNAKLDGNSDGYVDQIIFLYPSPNGSWSNMLWPHMWNLTSSTGASYSFSSSLYGKNYTFGNYGMTLHTICHESLHVLGLDDMYSYVDNTVDIAGQLSIMNGDGFNISSIEREQLGFLTVPQITLQDNESKTLTLNPLGQSQQNNAYRYKVPGTDSTLYFEYRTPNNPYEHYSIGSGLVIWRYDEIGKAIYGNRYGPPFFAYALRALSDETHYGDINTAFISDKSMITRAGYDSDGNSTALCLDIPKYTLFKISSTNPLREGDRRVYVNQNYATRLTGTVSAGISIYNVTENQNGTLTFTIKKGTMDIVNDPKFSLLPGSYSGTQTLNLSSNDNADIYYTIDGTNPDPEHNTNAIKYSTPITLSGNVTVRAVCVSDDGQKSDIAGGDYSCFAPNASLPFYDGTGNNTCTYVSNYNSLIITFENVDAQNPYGVLSLIDRKSSILYNFDVASLSGKTILIHTTGNLIFQVSSSTAIYKIKEIKGYNEKVSFNLSTFYLLDSELDTAQTLTEGNTYYLKNYVYDFLGKNADIVTCYAFYDKYGKLVDVKSVNDTIYSSNKRYTVGCKFVYSKDMYEIKAIVFEKDKNSLEPLSRRAISIKLAS